MIPTTHEIETLANGAKQSKLEVRCDLLPPNAVLSVSEVLAFGANKYGDKNWHGIAEMSHINHAMNHIFLYLTNDVSENHLEHAACRLLMALEKRHMDISKREAK